MQENKTYIKLFEFQKVYLNRIICLNNPHEDEKCNNLFWDQPNDTYQEFSDQKSSNNINITF